MGVLAGALVTAVLQSSSATTVMVIGFVSAGLMSLPQAISVIFGANIGTTMTAQLMAFKISNYIYPIIFIGFMLNFVGKKLHLWAATRKRTIIAEAMQVRSMHMQEKKVPARGQNLNI